MSAAAMLTDPADPAAADHAVFRAVLGALAHPGRRFELPAGADALAVVRSVYEPDTPIWTQGGWALGSGACEVRVEDAQLLLIAGASSGGAIARACRGTEAQPELGAMMLYAIDGDAPAISVTLTGPGVDGELRARLTLDSGELAARAKACAQAPLGIDCLIVTGGGGGVVVVGIPRGVDIGVDG